MYNLTAIDRRDDRTVYILRYDNGSRKAGTVTRIFDRENGRTVGSHYEVRNSIGEVITGSAAEARIEVVEEYEAWASKH